MYQAIDFGCNFASLKRYPLPKLHQILTKAQEANIAKCLVISNSLAETRHILKVLLPEASISSSEDVLTSTRRDMLTFTVGIHPHNANRFHLVNDIHFIRNTYISNPNCVAIGEMGLDYNRMFSKKEEQLAAFEAQLLLAKELNAPMYCHVRDAFEDFQMVLEKHQYFRGIIHCFTGSKEEAMYFLDRGFYLGITGVLMDKRRNRNVVEAIREAPMERLIIETDAPFMAYFGQKESFPQDVFHLVQEIALLKGLSEQDCGEQLLLNAVALMSKV